MNSPKAVINVTPLIDILLVLLIMFMVISPMKASRFEASVPHRTDSDTPFANGRLTLVVRVNSDTSLDINSTKELGTIDAPQKLIRKLQQVFAEREKNGVTPLSQTMRIPSKVVPTEKTVFIKAPRSLGYGQVVKVIDAVKISGAAPISLQIDDLD
ncbi:MAG: hypothetical protein HKN25_07310 [Pyrinomonadaceae bacterium]|nr:hypothetical protein [Pyrinomonadaceae bacterium]